MIAKTISSDIKCSIRCEKGRQVKVLRGTAAVSVELDQIEPLSNWEGMVNSNDTQARRPA